MYVERPAGVRDGMEGFARSTTETPPNRAGEEQRGVGRWWLAIVGFFWRCLGDQQLARHRYLFSPMSRCQRAVVARAWWSSEARLGIAIKSSCDKNGCDVLVGKQLMRPAFRCRMAAVRSLNDFIIPGKPLRYNPPRVVITLPAHRRRLRSRRRVVFLVFNEDRLESFPRPKVRRVDFFQAGGVPIWSRARWRPARLHRSRNGGKQRLQVRLELFCAAGPSTAAKAFVVGP